MPGYNHYPDCSCGWCVKPGLTRSQRAEWTRFFDNYAANAFLASHGARRGGVACFVNPNAQCPICGAAVFYYENRYGSRVFFDDLGNGWPKHPCTDRKPIPKGWASEGPAPTRRRAGLAAELVEAASQVGSFKGQQITASGHSRWPTLVEVVEVARDGLQNFVIAEFVEVMNTQAIFFTFTSAYEVLQVGDFLMVKGNQMSLWDTAHGRPVSYVISIFEKDRFG